MLKKILIVLGTLIVVFFVAAALRSPTFRIARSISIDAPASVVFPQVNDFHNWDNWSPYAKMDPQMKKSYEGASAGPGAIYTWDGPEAGQGRMTITETRPDELVRIKLEFTKPFEATNQAEFTFTPQGRRTLVEWRMSGENNFIGKAMGMVMDFDTMIGKDFEKGLVDMKAVAESKSKS